MPLQIWTPDHTAQLTAAAGQNLARGISSFGNSIGRALERHQEEKKKKEEELKSILAADKAAISFADALPDEMREQLKLPDKYTMRLQPGGAATAMMTGAFKALGAQQAHSQIAEAMARKKQAEAEAKNNARFPAFADEMGRYAPPGDLPYNIPPQDFERLALPEGQTQPGPRELFQALSRTKFNPGNEMSQLVNALEQKRSGALDLSTAFDMARNPPPGFGAGTVNINPNGTPGLQFGPAPLPAPTVIKPLPLEGGGQSGKGLYGDKIVDVPTDRSKALTDAQANALQFSERMAFNNSIIDHLEEKGFNPASTGAAVQGALPNFLTGDMRQQYDAAAHNWVSAVLRKESGAAISKSEETAALSQYFPKFGDSPAVVKQKSELRRLAEKNMRRAVGDIPAGNTGSTDAEVSKRIGGVRTAIDGRVMVSKDGKKFWLPEAQLPEALRSGYQRVP